MKGKGDLLGASVYQALWRIPDNVTSSNSHTSFIRQLATCGHSVCYEHHPYMFIMCHVINSAFQQHLQNLATPASQLQRRQETSEAHHRLPHMRLAFESESCEREGWRGH